VVAFVATMTVVVILPQVKPLTLNPKP
jgi:hypothetical protein